MANPSSLLPLLLLLSGWHAVRGCPEGEAADKFLLHFRPDQPKGVPGLDLPDPFPIMSPLWVGPVTLLDTQVGGLGQMVLHNFSIQAHLFNASLSLSVPRLVLSGIYEIPGIWWTTTGNFTVTLVEVRVSSLLKVAVLEDSCFYIQDFETNITQTNMSYSTEGLLDDSGMLNYFFDEIFSLLVNMTKPAILEIVNQNLRMALLTFLPPAPDLPLAPPSPQFPDLANPEMEVLDADEAALQHLDAPLILLATSSPVIPSHEDQVQALRRFVRFQIPWMIGDPLLLPNITLNIMGIAELHNISVNNLEHVTQVLHLSLDYDGEKFTMTTQMLHSDVYNRHRVLWFPGAIFRTWQWTQAALGLVKHRAVISLERRLLSPPVLEDFAVRQIVFDPNHSNAAVRGMDRMARRLMDGMRTQFGDRIKALMYSPIVTKVNRVLREVEARTLIRNFVCYAAGMV